MLVAPTHARSPMTVSWEVQKKGRAEKKTNNRRNVAVSPFQKRTKCEREGGTQYAAAQSPVLNLGTLPSLFPVGPCSHRQEKECNKKMALGSVCARNFLWRKGNRQLASHHRMMYCAGNLARDVGPSTFRLLRLRIRQKSCPGQQRRPGSQTSGPSRQPTAERDAQPFPRRPPRHWACAFCRWSFHHQSTF